MVGRGTSASVLDPCVCEGLPRVKEGSGHALVPHQLGGKEEEGEEKEKEEEEEARRRRRRRKRRRRRYDAVCGGLPRVGYKGMFPRAH